MNRYMIILVLGFTEQKHCLKAGKGNTQGKKYCFNIRTKSREEKLKGNSSL